MILTFVNAGTSGSEGIDYLFSEKDANGKERDPPAELLEGNVLLTKYLIQHNQRRQKYSSYAISFRDNEYVTDDQLKEIVQSLRDTFCTGLGPDRVNILAVKHTDKNNTEVHIIINNEELTTGRQFTPFPPGARSKKLQQDFCAYWNHRLGFEQVVANPFKASFSSFDAKAPIDRKNKYLKKVGNHEAVATKERKDKLSNIVSSVVMAGKVNNRNELISFLETNDCTITRRGQDYLSIVLPGKVKPVRFKGGCFVEGVDYRTLIAEHNSSSKTLNSHQFKEIRKNIQSAMDYKRALYEKIYSSKKQRMPSGKYARVSDARESKVDTNAEVEKKPSNDVLQKAPMPKNMKVAQSSTILPRPHEPKAKDGVTRPITSGYSTENLLINIGSIETEIFALGQKLSQAPYSQRSQIERQLGELKMQLQRLQNQLEEMKKAELNRIDKNKLRI